MHSFVQGLRVFFLMGVSLNLSAATLYVDVNNTGPALPYGDWATAATNIQDAVDAAVAGDLIIVTNGVYETGARFMGGTSNRVVVPVALTVRSVNGPAVTAIRGCQVPVTICDTGAVRCVYLANKAVLSGFTLCNGAAAQVVAGQQASGGGAYGGTLTNCVVAGNAAAYGGGGAYGCCLLNCAVSNNWAGMYGGGVYSCRLGRCTVSGNSTDFYGGGAASTSMTNCVVTGNRAGLGGGLYEGTLLSSTVTGNSAVEQGGGACSVIVVCNSIIYYNSAREGANTWNCTLSTSCFPLADGAGSWSAYASNINTEPQLASASQLGANSPCRGAGRYNSVLMQPSDMDGDLWNSPPSIGCNEYISGSATGAVRLAISASAGKASPGAGVDFRADIDGRVSESTWDFGDGSVLSNRPYARHSWARQGEYEVVLRAYSDSYPAGISATTLVHVVTQPTHFVSLASSSPEWPYNSWATAATNIQDAVDAAEAAGALVLVSNGVYESGIRAVYGRSNRLAVTRPVMVRSVNGPAETIIRGYQQAQGGYGSNAVRCVYLTNDAVLSGFTLAGGATQISGYSTTRLGGGAWCEPDGVLTNCVVRDNLASQHAGGVYGGVLDNCTVTGNSASNGGGGAAWAALNGCTLATNSASSGGGAFASTLKNSAVIGNTATSSGGGASSSILNNCTLIGNLTQGNGGGTYSSTNINCILYYNSGVGSASNFWGGKLNYCCTMPLPASGQGNFTNAPALADWAGGDVRLEADSPCINAGQNASVPGATDFYGNPRISGGTVDVGASEFQSPASRISYAWLQQFQLPVDGSADYLDPDADHQNNWQEWQAGTDPTNPASALRIKETLVQGTNVSLTWSSVSNRTYFVERATNLPPSSAFLVLTTNIRGLANSTSVIDTNPPASGPAFYRVGVQP